MDKYAAPCLGRWKQRLWTPVLVSVWLSGCQDLGPTGPTELAEESRLNAAAASAARKNLITHDTEVFAAAVREIDNENELLVWIKDARTPPRAAEYFLELGLQRSLKIGLPNPAPNQRARMDFGPARVSSPAMSAVRQALARFDIAPYNPEYAFPFFAIRVPDEALVPVLRVLLSHPNIDYVEPNEKQPVHFRSGPLGTNPTDQKHALHNVQQAWAYTRGSGVQIGIMDTGFAYDRNLHAWTRTAPTSRTPPAESTASGRRASATTTAIANKAGKGNLASAPPMMTMGTGPKWPGWWEPTTMALATSGSRRSRSPGA